jgi:hypothetical protein
MWCCAVESFSTVVVPGKWSVVPTLHCGRTVAACLHALQALTILHAHMSCMPMKALTSDTLKTCVCALETCVPDCTGIGMPARLFFMIEAHGPQGAVGHVVALEPTSAKRRGLKP